MKFGIRKPSIKKSIAAKTSIKRYVRHNLEVKTPKGAGYITNPKKALYNHVYRKTTTSVYENNDSLTGGFVILLVIIVVIVILFIVFFIK